MHVLLLTPSLSDNVLGRAYSLWLILRAGGHHVSVIGPASNGLWPPMRATEFSKDCMPTSARPDKATRRLADEADVLLSLKAWPKSLDLGMSLRRLTGRPLVIDIDDPDAEFIGEQLGASPFRTRWRLRHQTLRPGRVARVRDRLAGETVICSNEPLAALYETDHVIPHARHRVPMGSSPVGTDIVVVFPGTPRPHKGLEVLRDAVERCGPGVRLLVTAPPPADARSGERWLGGLPFSATLDLVCRADVVAVPSDDSTASRYQLPVKLIDAMMAGRAVLASDVAPIRWATAGRVPLASPGNLRSMTTLLEALREPEMRRETGHVLRALAIERFTPESLAQALTRVLNGARGTPGSIN